LQSPNGANEAALRFQIIQVPGIQDVVFAPVAGTFTCYVYGIASDGSAALLQNVQQAINNTVAFPLTGIAVAPDLVGISLTTTLTLTAVFDVGHLLLKLYVSSLHVIGQDAS